MTPAKIHLSRLLRGPGPCPPGRLPAPKAAQVHIKFVIYDNDNTFAATVYAQEVSTGKTTTFAYGPHTPYIDRGPEGPRAPTCSTPAWWRRRTTTTTASPASMRTPTGT